MAGSNINRISVFAKRTIKCALVHITGPLKSHSIFAIECSIYDIDSRCLPRVIPGCQEVVTGITLLCRTVGTALHFRHYQEMIDLNSNV